MGCLMPKIGVLHAEIEVFRAQNRYVSRGKPVCLMPVERRKRSVSHTKPVCFTLETGVFGAEKWGVAQGKTVCYTAKTGMFHAECPLCCTPTSGGF
jgi:hypothetical protein